MREILIADDAVQEMDRLTSPLRDRIFEVIESLAEFPNMGQQIERSSLRKFACKPYWIVYQLLEDDTLYVRLLWHMRRDEFKL